MAIARFQDEIYNLHTLAKHPTFWVPVLFAVSGPDYPFLPITQSYSIFYVALTTG